MNPIEEKRTQGEHLSRLLQQLLRPDNNVILADELMVSDGNGIVLFVSDTYDQHFGVSQAYVVGKSVYELEREGVFTPCITAMVLSSKKRVTSQQYNNQRRVVHTTGIPVFGEDGEIQYVICFNSLELKQLENLRERYSALKAVLEHKDEEMEALRRTLIKPKEMIIRSKPMTMLWESVTHIAPTKANILLTGETGVGKTQLAREIHRISDYAAGPFVEINCAAIHENLIESELFGYEKGAFTGADSKGKMGKIELANHGTLFLDEVSELSLSAQAKLLQAIQDKTLYRVSGTKEIHVNFRLITASNQDLLAAVADNRFRNDLYYRLNVFSLHIPPLRERRGDIVPLTAVFLDRFNREYGKSIVFSPALMERLEECPWPGNIREMENLVERMVVTSVGNVVDWDALPPHYRVAPSDETLTERLERFEEKIITETYARLHTSTAVAKALGISQPTAIRKIHKYVNTEGKQESCSS